MAHLEKVEDNAIKEEGNIKKLKKEKLAKVLKRQIAQNQQIKKTNHQINSLLKSATTIPLESDEIKR